MNEHYDLSNSQLGKSEFAIAAANGSAPKADEKAPIKQPKGLPAGTIEEAEQDAKDPTHEKEVEPKKK